MKHPYGFLKKIPSFMPNTLGHSLLSTSKFMIPSVNLQVLRRKIRRPSESSGSTSAAAAPAESFVDFVG